MRIRLPQFGINTLLLGVAILCVWIVQSWIALEEEQRLLVAPFDDVRVTPVLGLIDFVIVGATIYFYRHYKSRAIWIATLVAILATGIVVLVSKAMQ